MERIPRIPAPGPIPAGAGRDFPAATSSTFPLSSSGVTSTSWRSDAVELGVPLVGTEKFRNPGVLTLSSGIIQQNTTKLIPSSKAVRDVVLVFAVIY